MADWSRGEVLVLNDNFCVRVAEILAISEPFPIFKTLEVPLPAQQERLNTPDVFSDTQRTQTMRRAACSILILFMAFSLSGRYCFRPRIRQDAMRPDDAFPSTQTFPAPARAAVATPEIARVDNSPEKKPVPRPRSTSGDARRSSTATSPWTTFGALAVVIILILTMARVWKKHGPLAQGAVPPEVIEMLGRKMVDQRQAISRAARFAHSGARNCSRGADDSRKSPIRLEVISRVCIFSKNGENGSLLALSSDETSRIKRAIYHSDSHHTRFGPARNATGTALRRPDSPRDGSLERLHG
jgi:hypothetical protein